MEREGEKESEKVGDWQVSRQSSRGSDVSAHDRGGGGGGTKWKEKERRRTRVGGWKTVDVNHKVTNVYMYA